MVRNAYQGVGSEYETLIKAFDKDCANFLKRVGKDRSIGTYKVMVRARNYVAAFIKSFYRRTDMSMLELTPDFIKEFAVYLTAERGLKKALTEVSFSEGKLTNTPGLTKAHLIYQAILLPPTYIRYWKSLTRFRPNAMPYGKNITRHLLNWSLSEKFVARLSLMIAQTTDICFTFYLMTLKPEQNLSIILKKITYMHRFTTFLYTAHLPGRNTANWVLPWK